jgi:hypothetical protein
MDKLREIVAEISRLREELEKDLEKQPNVLSVEDKKR